MKATASRRADSEIGQVLDIQVIFHMKKMRPEAILRLRPLYKT
jgi:hypothetical protein